MTARVACVLRRLHAVLSVGLVCTCLFPGSVRGQSGELEALQQRLDERDKVICELMRRVEALEQKLSTPPKTSSSSPQQQAAAVPGRQAETGAGAPATQLDEEQGARALERALVREGGLVLPRSVYEIEPAFTYRHREREGLTAISVAGESSVALRVQRRETLESSLALRVGLPWSSQVGVRIPHVVSRTQLVVAGLEEQTHHDSALGRR